MKVSSEAGVGTGAGRPVRSRESLRARTLGAASGEGAIFLARSGAWMKASMGLRMEARGSLMVGTGGRVMGE